MGEAVKLCAELSQQQEGLIQALLSSRSHVSALRKAKVSSATLYNWLKIPAFKEAYLAARRLRFSEAMTEAQIASLKATRALVKNLDDGSGNVRNTAAVALLDCAERASMENVLERLEALEAKVGKKK